MAGNIFAINVRENRMHVKYCKLCLLIASIVLPDFTLVVNVTIIKQPQIFPFCDIAYIPYNPWDISSL